MSESEDPRELARRLAEEAKARNTKPAAAPKPPPAKRSFADRAPKPTSAKAALQAALEAEAREAEQASKADAARLLVEQAKQRLAAQAPAPVAAPAATPKAAAPKAAPVAAAPSTTPASVLERRLPGYTVSRVVAVDERTTFAALWTAHRVRAAVEGDTALMVTADVLLHAATRLGPGALHAAEVTAPGADTPSAIFLDTADGVLLGVAQPAALYLAGL